MILIYFGEDIFLEGVRCYFKKYVYGNIQIGDFWVFFVEVSGKGVEDVMQVWIKNIGYFVVIVEEKGDNIVKLKQNCFLCIGDIKFEEDKVIYFVFLGFCIKDGIDEL